VTPCHGVLHTEKFKEKAPVGSAGAKRGSFGDLKKLITYYA